MSQQLIYGSRFRTIKASLLKCTKDGAGQAVDCFVHQLLIAIAATFRSLLRSSHNATDQLASKFKIRYNCHLLSRCSIPWWDSSGDVVTAMLPYSTRWWLLISSGKWSLYACKFPPPLCNIVVADHSMSIRSISCTFLRGDGHLCMTAMFHQSLLLLRWLQGINLNHTKLESAAVDKYLVVKHCNNY